MPLDLAQQGTPLDLSGSGSPLQRGPDLSGAGKPLDLSGAGKPLNGPEDTGYLGAITGGFKSALRGIGQTAETATGHQPTAAPPENTVAAQPMTWGDFLNPRVAAEKTLYSLTEGSPQFAAFALGSLVGGGPEEPVGLATGAVSAGAMAFAQSLGPRFAANLQQNPQDPDGAFDRAVQGASAEGAIGAIGQAAFSIAPFKGAVKNILFQALGVQPAVQAAGTAASNVIEGRPVGEGVAESIPGAIIGTAVPMAGHEIGRRMAGPSALERFATSDKTGQALADINQQQPVAPPAAQPTMMERALTAADQEARDIEPSPEHTGAEAVDAVQRATDLERQANAPNMPPEQKQGMLDEAKRLRDEFGQPRGRPAVAPEARPPAAEAPPAPPPAPVPVEAPKEGAVEAAPAPTQTPAPELAPQPATMLANREFREAGAQPAPGRVEQPVPAVPGPAFERGTREAPVKVEAPADIEDARAKVNPEPTEGQKEAGNYAKGHIDFQGLPVTIENPKGSVRRGVDSQGKPWESVLPTDYGYIKRTEGADGDHVDAFVGPDPKADRVFLVDQKDPATGKFDEHKAFLGYPSEEAALVNYYLAFSDDSGPSRVGGFHSLSMDEFKRWLKEGDTKKPYGEGQASTTETPSGVEIRQNVEKGGYELKFPGRPDDATLAAIKAAGFKWSGRQKIWYAKQSPQTKAIVDRLRGAPAEATPTAPQWREIGKNAAGQSVFEDQRGVRSIVENGIRHTEPVQIIPGKGIALDPARRGDRFNIVKPEERIAQLESDRSAEARGEKTAGSPAQSFEAIQKELGTSEQPNVIGLGKRFREAFAAGKTFGSITEARKFAADLLGGEVPERSRKALDEAIEYGVTLRARELVQEGRGRAENPVATFDKLVALYKAQPLLNERTADAKLRQAYSTPAPIAFLASRLADVRPDTIVYEPTAGNGMLLIGADKRNVVANELDPTRRAALEAQGYTTTGKDAATWAPERKSDRVIANPPFGKLEGKRWRTPRYTTQEIDHAIAFKALEAMKDDGRAVLILGGQKAIGKEEIKKLYNTAEQRAFFKALFDDYKVTDHFQIAGDLYNRQGAAWPIDIIKIEGRGKSDRPLPGVAPPRILDSFDQLRDLVHDSGRVVSPGEQPRPDSDLRPTGLGPDVPGVRGADGRPGARDDQARGQAGHPGGGPDLSAAGQPIPEPAAEPVGGGTAGGRGARADEAGGEHGPVAEEGRPAEPAGPGGAGRGEARDVASPRGPEGEPPRVDDISKAIDDALDDVFGEEPTPEPRAVSEPTTAPPRAAAPQSPDAVRSMDEIAKDLDAMFMRPRAEDAPRADLEPGVDSAKYEKAQPLFHEAMKALGAKDGDDVVTLAKKLVEALKNVYNFTRDKIAAMKPYLTQFIKDVKAGAVKLAQAFSQRRENLEKETRLQVKYEPSSDAEPVGTLVPVNMQAAITRSLDALQERVGNIDQYVADQLGFTRDQVVGTKDKLGIFSAEQADALALAIDNYGRGGALILGDQTGVGKGRVVAGMMRYAQRQGKVPIFVTQSPGLYADIYRDLRDIGQKDFKALVTNTDLTGKDRVPLNENEFVESLPQSQQARAFSEILKSGRLPKGYDALFTTYSQMQFGGKGKEYDRHGVLRALAPNSFVIFDESHEAGGTETKRIDPETGDPIPGRSDFARELLGMAPGAMYSSATYAKNPHVMSLYFKTDMGLAVDKMEELTDLIKSGGVPLQQAIANMLVEAGQYARRERSYDGVEMRMNTVAADKATAERVSESLRRIFDFDKRAEHAREAFGEDLAAVGGAAADDNAIGDTGVSSVNFSSLMHNIIGQSLLAMKTDHAVGEAVEAWKRGEKPIIALSNTFGALLDRYVSESHLKPGADLSKLTFNKVFENYLQRTREVTVKDPHDKSKKERVYIDDQKMRELGYGHLVTQYDQLKKTLQGTDLGKMPASPIDRMLDEMRKAGMKVGEITGRELVIDNGSLAQRDASAAAKKRIMNDFNSGKLDALVINRSGSTGFSLHASEKYRDLDRDGKQIPARQRHMILLQPEPNIDTFMQILGRVHRTGQIVLPRYQLLVSDLPTEKRPAAVLMRKLGSLNANTSANRESAVSLDRAVDFMNQYGDEVVGEILRDEPEIADALDIHPNNDGQFREGIAAKATGRLAVLPIARQEEIYGRIERNYNDMIETLNSLGQNALEAKTVDLDARTTGSQPITEDKGVESPFGKPAMLEEINVRRLGKPYTLDEVRDRIAQIAGLKGRSEVAQAPRAHEQLKANVAADAIPYIDGVRQEYAEAQEAAAKATEELNNNTEEDRQKRLETAAQRANDRVSRISDRLTNLHEAQGRVGELMDDMRPGKFVNIKYGEGDKAETYQGITLGVAKEGKAKNPLAFSNYVARVAVADGSREIKIPLSKIASDRFKVEATDRKTVEDAFANGMAGGRENRHVVTGNLLSGYKTMGGHGQITMFTDSQGNVRPGILLARGFDPGKELAKRPVVLNPAQTIRFLDQMGKAGKSVLVRSDDGKLSVQRLSTGNYELKANAKGGKPFYLNRAVNEELGHNQFRQRRGAKTWDATARADQIGKILDLYAGNLGTQFHADIEKEAAKQIVQGDRPQLQRAEGEATATAEEMPLTKGLVGEPTERLTENQEAAANVVAQAAQQMFPGAKLRFMKSMRTTEETGNIGPVAGAAFHDGANYIIAVALSDKDPVHVLRHEGIHYLKRVGLLDKDAWGVLAKAAEDGKWVEKNKIVERWPELKDRDRQIEEAVAEEFAQWRRDPTGAANGARGVFAKLAEFFRRVARGVRNVFGDVTADDLFHRIEEGEIGKAPSPQEGEGEAAFARRAPEPEEEQRRPADIVDRAAAVTRDSTVGQLVRRLFSPGSFDESAKAAAAMIRRTQGRAYVHGVQVAERLKAVREAVGKATPELREAFARAVDTGDFGSLHGGYRALAEGLRDVTREETGRLQRLGKRIGKPILADAIENYLGRYWKPRGETAGTKEAADKVLAALAVKQPLTGPKSFLRARHYDTWEAARAAGLEPVFENPVDAHLAKLAEMNRFWAGTVISEAAKRGGFAEFRTTRPPPELGLMELEGPEFQRRERIIEKEDGSTVTVPQGAWYAPEGFARVLNNFTSRGLESTLFRDPVRQIRNVANGLNQLQLGFSLFHPVFTTLDAQISRLGMAIDSATRGQFGKAAAQGLEALTPINWYTNVRDGDRLLKSILRPEDAPPAMRQLVDAFGTAGGRIWMDRILRPTDEGAIKFWKSGAIGTALRAAATKFPGNPLKQALNIAGRAIETTSAPIMDVLVPRQKLGVFSRLASDWLERNPEHSAADYVKAMQDIWETVDNRLGQMVYDNLFWSKTLKDIAFLTTRSVGWNMGSLREIGGGIGEAGSFARNLATGRASEAEWTRRMSYLIALPVMTAVYGAMYQYLATGQGPQDLKDYFFPRTGLIRTHDRQPERVSLPTYMKDVYAWMTRPMQTAKNKANPIIALFNQAIDGRDYFGYIIANYDDPVVKQIEDVMKWAVTAVEPFSVQATSRMFKERSGPQAVAGMLGFTPAPGYIANPSGEEKWAERQHRIDVQKKNRFEQGQNRPQAVPPSELQP